MLRGYRGIFLAFGLILSAATQPQHQNGQNPAKTTNSKIEHSLNGIISTQHEAEKASDLDKPCKEGDDNRASDLCAQWKAANAAQNATTAAWLFGALGSLIGAFTLAAAVAAAKFAKNAADHTETGAKAAQDAVSEARRIGEAQVRCYLTVSNVQISFESNRIDTVKCEIRNTGQSPAIDVKWAIVLHIIREQIRRESELFEGSYVDATETIGAQESCEFLPVPAEFAFDADDLATLAAHPNPGIGIVANVDAEGRDVFGCRVHIRQNFLTVIHHCPADGETLTLHRFGRASLHEDRTTNDYKDN